MRSTAHRIQTLKTEANELERDIARPVDDVHPELAQLPGVGAPSAAQS
jgi:endonuclease III